jgi:hypothetical protein
MSADSCKLQKFFAVLCLCVTAGCPNGSKTTVPTTPGVEVAEDGVKAVLTKVVVDQVADRIDSSIDKAGRTVDDTTIRAGQEATAAISNFRVAYEDMLNQSIDKLDATATKQLDTIKSTADALERRSADDLIHLGQITSQGLLIIPLTDKSPQVTTWSPSYEVYRATGDNFQLSLNGIFAYADQNNMSPYVLLGPQKINPVHVTTQKLEFEVPRAALKPPDGKTTSYTKLDVLVPYEKSSGVLGLSKQRAEGKFSIGLIGLPEYPGKITVTSSSTIKVPDQHHVVTVQDNQQSDKDDWDRDHCGPNETTGTIVASSVRMVVDRHEGSSWTNHPVRTTNPSVCWNFRTQHHGFGTSDKVWFHFEYDVAGAHPEQRSNNIDLPLRWGDSRVVEIPIDGSYVVHFAAFDGSSNDYAAANHSNRYIDITPEGNGNNIRVQARPVSNITR